MVKLTGPVIAAERDNNIVDARWHAHIPARLPGPPKAAMLLVRVAETLVEATYFAGRAVARTTTSKITGFGALFV